MWQIVAFFFLFPLSSLHESLVLQCKYDSLRICHLILGMFTFLGHIKFPFLLVQMCNMLNCFNFFHMLFKLVRFPTQMTFFPFTTRHTMHLIWLIFYEHFWTFLPTKIMGDIVVFFGFLWQKAYFFCLVKCGF